MKNKFSVTREAFDPISRVARLGSLPPGMAVAELGRLDWHIRTAAVAVSGTAQHAAYNGLLEFVASRYAELAQVSLDDRVYDQLLSKVRGNISAIRSSNSETELQHHYLALVEKVATFWTLAATPQPEPSAADKARRRTIAEAIWSVRRQEEDREDMELDDMPETHSVWAEADAVMLALAV
jgi:hypothetical protein